MGAVVLAAKVTHVPSMLLSEQPGPHHGCRAAAIEGHREIGRRAAALGADTAIVFDVHWLVNSGHHLNCAARFEGTYTSGELPHFVRDLDYAYEGDPALGRAIAAAATARGVRTRSHEIASLGLEYGTLVPMRYMNGDGAMRVISVAAWCANHPLEASAELGAAVREAVEASGARAVVLASGSLSHRFHDDADAEAGIDTISAEFHRQVDLRVLELWQAGRFDTFCAMLPEYARLCHGEGGMHDTAMLLGALGWDRYREPVEIVTGYFPSSGTGQVNAVFPVPA